MKDMARIQFEKLYRAACLGFVIFAMTNLGGCKWLYKQGYPIPDQLVSGPVEIGPEWVEIVPPKPLIPYGIIMEVLIKFEKAEAKDIGTEYKSNIIKFPDGEKTKIEAILYDDSGKAYDLIVCGAGNGITFCRKDETEVPDGTPRPSTPDFPEDRIYTKLRLRSEMPVKIDSITWHCWVNWIR